MALTGIQILKMLPKKNCGECKIPTCLAFAMALAAGKAELALGGILVYRVRSRKSRPELHKGKAASANIAPSGGIAALFADVAHPDTA